MKKINAKGKAVLLIGDSHLPYEHADYLKFCQAVAKKMETDIHIHMGDYEDQHAISFHDSDADLMSAGDELELVIEKTKYWKKAFPKLTTLHSNHGSLVIRRFKKHGIPMAHLKSLGEVYDTPDWTWHHEILLETSKGQVYLHHGKAGPYLALCKEMGCSAVQGHFHSKCEITYLNAGFNERWNMFTGCGVNQNSMAMAYGKDFKRKPVLGCGAIDENGVPHLFRMHLNSKGRWDKKL